MINKIISTAILTPYAYPWIHENFGLSREELDLVLEEKGLRSLEDRRIAGWIIKFNILKESSLLNSLEEITKKVVSNLNDKKYIDTKVIVASQKRLIIYTDTNLKQYKRLIKNEINGKEMQIDIEKNISWLLEVVAYYLVNNNSIRPIEIQDEVEKLLKDKYKISSDVSRQIKDIQGRKGYTRSDILDLFKNNMLVYREEIKELFSKVICCTEEKNENISESILDLFSAMPEFVIREEPIVEEEPIGEEEIVNITKDKDEIFEDLKKLSKGLGYTLAGVEEVVVSLDKYTSLIEADKEKEVKLLKELCLLRNGAILSELYNAYKDIENTSKENLEAILANLFTTLSLNGFEVIESVRKVGEELEVNTSNVLKEFIFSQPINKDGQVKGIVKYLGWSYKDKQIFPMVINPKII